MHEARAARDPRARQRRDVNNSSIGGPIGLPGRAAHHGGKHAILGMTKSAGVEYALRGIGINAVGPGTIDTPMA